MSSSMSINVLYPNGRRHCVKVSPNTSILEVLEEACRKQGLKPDAYDIRHYNRTLDLSLSVRFANLPNNAMVELSPSKQVRQEDLVTVALQLESGERLTCDFPPSSSIWDVVNKCISSRKESMGKHELSNGEPVCIYMQQKFIGDQMRTTTLRSLGLTRGKAIIRLIYRPLESLSEQAHITSPLTKPSQLVSEKNDDESAIQRKSFRSEINTDHTAKKQPRLDIDVSESAVKECPANENTFYSVSNFSREIPLAEKERIDEPMQCEDAPEVNESSQKTEIVKNENDSAAMELEKARECEETVVKEIGEIKYLGPRNAVLFKLEDILEIKKDDFPDEFFELTINDVRYLMEEYKRVRVEMENEPLLSRRQRENCLLQQLSRYKQSVIRVYFPDQLVLQGTFIADETVQSVIEFVRSFLEDPNLDFYLYIAPPKTKLIKEKTLLETRLVPAAVVYFGCDMPCANYLRLDIQNQVSDPRAASLVAAECRRKVNKNQSVDQLSNVEDVAEQRAQIVSNSSLMSQDSNIHRITTLNGRTEVPKWFKLGKK